ncbi:MAG: hypothetical protein ACXVIL_10945 [Halobacteriota archaeon]
MLEEINLRRKEREEITDKFLLMHVIFKAQEHELNVLKVEKLAFLIEALTHKERIKTFSYIFVQTADSGPKSYELRQDYNMLLANQIVAPETPKLTLRGEDILAQSHTVLEKNRAVTHEIDKIINKYNWMTLDQLNQFIGESEITHSDETKKIKDIPGREEVFSPLPDCFTNVKFKIDDTWAETLDILLDEPFYSGLCQALKDAKRGRVYDSDEVFKDA